MEPRFGHDFSKVRIHADSRAAASAQEVSALAYTVGNSVAFGEGHYAPRSVAGRKLLAHELAHVVQQSGISTDHPLPRHIGDAHSPHEQEADSASIRVSQGSLATPLAPVANPALQRTMICSKRLEAPVAGWVANHAYIDDTGRDDCRGASTVGNYAVQQLVSGNFLRGCAIKTDRSTDPQTFTPNMKPCRPKAGVSNLSQCLRDAFNAYADPSVYSNEVAAGAAAVGGAIGGYRGYRVGSTVGSVFGPVGRAVGGAVGAGVGGFLGAKRGVELTSSFNGPNSNTFTATLARACCEDSSDSGLGLVPGWGHAPASPCPTATPSPSGGHVA